MLGYNTHHLFLTFLLVCGIGFSAFAQPTIADSLVLQLEQGPNTIEVLEKMARFRNFDDSIGSQLANIGLRYARQHDLPYWEADFLLTQCKFHRDRLEVDSSITKALQAEQLIKRYQLPDHLEKRAYISLANGFLDLGAFKQAIKYRKIHLSMLSREVLNEQVFYSTRALGGVYLRIDAYDSAAACFKDAAAYARQYNNQLWCAGAMNDIGLALFEFDQLDSAQVYFERARAIYQVGDSDIDSAMVGIVGGNLAQCFPIAEERDRIVSLLQENIRITRKFKADESLSNAYCILAEVCIELGQLKQAETCLDSAYYLNRNLPNDLEASEKRLEIHEMLMSIYEQTEDFENFKEQHGKWRQINDSLYGKSATKLLFEKISDFRVRQIDNNLNLERALLNQSREENQVLFQKKELADLRILLLITLVVSGLLIGFIIFYKMRSDFRKKRAMEELSRKVLESTIQAKNNQLTQTIISVSRKAEFSEALVNQLSTLKGIDSKELNHLNLYIRNELQIDQNLLETEQSISELSQAFFVKLDMKFPRLSASDKKLCALIMLELTNKEIAIAKNITPQSVKIAKNRLRKKLNLDSGANLADFLRSI